MKKLKAFFDRKGWKYTETSYGCNYFNDHSLDLHFEGLTIGIDCEYCVKNHINMEEIIRKYCKRYGYMIIQTGGFPGFHYMNITTTAAAEAMKNYQRYSRESVRQCEKHMHFMYTYFGKNVPTLNEELAGIMEFFEDEYKAFLAAEKAA